MKILFILFTLLGVMEAKAGKCSWYDQEIIYDASLGRLEPAYATLRQGDKVCLRLRAYGGSYGIMISGWPYFMRANPKNSDEVSFNAFKTGTFKVNCTGCGVSATLEVLSKESFDSKARQYYEKESLLNRRNNWK